jgi:acyl carrier protein
MNPRGHPTRLSLFQESIWFFRLLDPAMGSFNVGRAWILKGAMDPAALQQALDLTAARHDTLRSQFVIDDGLSCMAEVPGRRLTCHITSFREEGSGVARDRALGFLQEEFTRQFEFSTEPLVRSHLVLLSSDESILMIVKPHLITDDTSISLFVTELARLYSGLRTGGDMSLPPAVQFATYAEWQRAYCNGPQVSEHLEYWRRQLTGAPASMRLRGRGVMGAPVTSPFAGAEAIFSISHELLDDLNEMRRKEGVTLYVVLLVAFAILLWLIGNQEDVVVGGLVANRVKPITRSMIGPLVNTFALRFRFEDVITFSDALVTARSLVTNAYRYAELPFERIIEDLKAAQKLDPRFRLDAVFDYFAAAPASPQFHELEATPLRIYRKRAQAGLTLKVWPDAQGMAVFFEYQKAQFDEADIERLFVNYESILRMLAKSPGAQLRSMSLPVGAAKGPLESVDAPAPAAAAPLGMTACSKVASTGSIAALEQLQHHLTRIWVEVIGVNSIGLDDDFFRLGGHSLLAVQIVNHIWDDLGVEVPMDLLFTEAVTVRALSQYVLAAPGGKIHFSSDAPCESRLEEHR